LFFLCSLFPLPLPLNANKIVMRRRKGRS
jgi:hypothetical protein